MRASFFVVSTLIGLSLASCSAPSTGASDLEPPEGTVSVHRPDAGVVMRDAGPQDAPSTEPSVAFESPSPGDVFVQDVLDGMGWAAEITFRVSASDVARVEYWAEDTTMVGAADGAPWEATALFNGTGERTVVARGLGADGAELVRDEVSFTVEPPDDTSCYAMLDAYGLDWSMADPSEGIEQPVMVQPNIRGVSYRYVSSAEPTAMLMDCSLGPRLARLSDLVKEYGVDEVVHIGIYNYRCIGGGDPDSGTCTPSQHAYARAIDIHELNDLDGGGSYNVETDWVITAETCPGTPVDEADRILHAVACRMYSDGIFHIVLTPNYNSAHRNHFHVDIKPDGDFIESGLPGGVDPWFAIGH